jgi:hypothetical protein
MEYRITLTASGTVTSYTEAQAFCAKQYAASLMNDGIAFSFELVKA